MDISSRFGRSRPMESGAWRWTWARSHPAHQDRLRYERAPQGPTKKTPPRDAAQGRSEILDLESRFRETLVRQGVGDGYLSAVGDQARLHRVKTFPMLGEKAIRDH